MTCNSMSRRSLLGGLFGSALVPGLAAGKTGLGETNPTSSIPTDPAGLYAPLSPEEYVAALRGGGVDYDAIPSIDAPQFWTAAEADDLLDGGDIVFGFVHGGEARAYPQRIMVRHEVINDTVGGLPVAITYCPLVGDILAVERGDTTFGVSGRIVNSNLTLFNRENGAHVPQMLSIWIDGPMAGRALIEHPVAWTTWDRWRALHPDTAVMCPPPGRAFDNYTDPYGGYNPLRGYYLPDRPPMFPPLHVDERFPPKRIFIGARTPDRAVAFDLALLRHSGVLEVEAGDEPFTAVYDADLDTGHVYAGPAAGRPRVEGAFPDRVHWQDGPGPRKINGFQAMWFAWVGFYPDVAVRA